MNRSSNSLHKDVATVMGRKDELLMSFYSDVIWLKLTSMEFIQNNEEQVLFRCVLVNQECMVLAQRT